MKVEANMWLLPMGIYVSNPYYSIDCKYHNSYPDDSTKTKKHAHQPPKQHKNRKITAIFGITLPSGRKKSQEIAPFGRHLPHIYPRHPPQLTTTAPRDAHLEA